MKRRIAKNFKYMRFILILAVTGLCFYWREPLKEKLHAFLAWGLKSYEQAIDFSERPDGSVSGNDTLSGGDGQSDVSGGDGAWGGMDVSGNGTDGNSISGNDISGNSVSGNGMAGSSWAYFTADESYFDDAVFIGDSRTVGLSEYAELENTTFYASTGLTVYKLFDAKIIPVEGSRQKLSVEEALSQKQFKKIYLMIGINEMGTGTVDSFMEKYREAVVHLQELQPDAVIYLQAIMRVTEERSDKGDYINNEGIDARNAEIAKLADNQRVFYLDVNPLVCDETGGMVKGYTFDGVHLKAEYIAIWKQFLLEHAVMFY